MKELFEKKRHCCGCGACIAVCPFKAIEMIFDWEGIPYPKVNSEKCVGCGLCEKVCPMKHYHPKEGEGIYFAVQAKEDSLRFSSSSGGVFPVLAHRVLKKGGVVFGAAMGKDGRVYHKSIQTPSELSLLQKSKYVQSDMGDSYQKVARYLREGRQVLFTGTPCQCQALKLYLREEKENLLLADLVCYGAPSPKIWEKYVKELEMHYKGKLSEFCFRDKREKDDGHTISFRIGNKEYTHPMGQDVYCKIYFQNYTIRPSCSSCKFCTVKRESDITMGDFWEVEKRRPEMNDKKGTSLIILQNEKAIKIWEEIKGEFLYSSCKKEEILQPRLCSPSDYPMKRRWGFMVLRRFLPLNLAERILRR